MNIRVRGFHLVFQSDQPLDPGGEQTPLLDSEGPGARGDFKTRSHRVCTVYIYIYMCCVVQLPLSSYRRDGKINLIVGGYTHYKDSRSFRWDEFISKELRLDPAHMGILGPSFRVQRLG